MSTTLAKGTAVVSLADGTKLGTIDHVYLDPQRKEIVGFSFHQGGLFGGKPAGVVDVGKSTPSAPTPSRSTTPRRSAASWRSTPGATA